MLVWQQKMAFFSQLTSHESQNGAEAVSSSQYTISFYSFQSFWKWGVAHRFKDAHHQKTENLMSWRAQKIKKIMLTSDVSRSWHIEISGLEIAWASEPP